MNRYKLIIVENDEDEQRFMKEGFEASGLYDLLALVRNGDQLDAWLKEHADERPDLVLSDLNMPGKDGYDIIREMQERPEAERVPVMITSTSTALSIMDKCLALGARGYIVKPEIFIDYQPFAEQLYGQLEEMRRGGTAL